MPSKVRPPKMIMGTRTRSNTLRSTIPMPNNSAVTTAQIVRTMKRGENGSSSVSMAPLGQILIFEPLPDPTIRTIPLTLSGVAVMDMTAHGGNIVPPWGDNPVRDEAILQCSSPRLITNGSEHGPEGSVDALSPSPAHATCRHTQINDCAGAVRPVSGFGSNHSAPATR